jgi:hypothetical protein
MAELIAFCGLDCSECEAYRATQAQDLAWKERVVLQWKTDYGAGDIGVKDVTCDGCTATTGQWGAHCYECEIRLCGLERGVANCAACPDYACAKLEGFLAAVPPARANLERLRA